MTKNGGIKVCEYQKDGNITGVFVFNKINNSADGIWASTKNNTEYKFQLAAKDTLLPAIDPAFHSGNRFGRYSYAYGKKGYQGEVTISEIKKNKISFSISSVTGEPGRNIAEIELDTIAIVNNEFVYKVPGSDSCRLNVKFYKDFLTVEYSENFGNCGDLFGLNATVDGIFIKNN